MRFFSGRKLDAQNADGFLELLNGPFLCLFATAIHHCLKQWSGGILDDRVDFKPQFRRDVYLRHLDSWNRIKPDRQRLILEMLRADIRSRLAARGKRPDQERREGYPEEGEDDEIDAYLATRLKEARAKLPGQDQSSPNSYRRLSGGHSHHTGE
ncbi:MAG: hypothetical protein M1826_001715 [Phylliscum demangeonii]|nr:MAG: hypothetical protein M1826_001715 [Phylliscum demangeonii]